MYYSHKRETGELEPLIDHLNDTAQRAARFAQPFGAAEYARMLGLAHDIGKYSKEYQDRLMRNGLSVDHSTAGMQALQNFGMIAASFCAAGHHTGLPDGGQVEDDDRTPTLFGRVKKLPPPCGDYRQEVELHLVPLPPTVPDENFSQAFFTRMLFSALVDANFLSIEAFMTGGAEKRGGYDDMKTLLGALEASLQPWLTHPENQLNAKRSEILRRCLEAGKGEKRVYSLTVPAGGGKTMASLAFALRHAAEHHMDRVVYVVPYTSVIEQTAAEFRKRLGDQNVLEHHAGVEFDQKLGEDPLQEQHRLSAENWDAPVVVTTSRQFFESLYANRSGRCRKLHNLTNSVIVFDEAQTLPLPYLWPCVRAIEELVRGYNATAVLCAATQPGLEKFFVDDIKPREICPDTAGLYAFFKSSVLRHIGKRTTEQMAEQMARHQQVLTIVSTRKQAEELYDQLPKKGRYHLSTLMYPAHRRRTLEEIRARLREGLPCRVAATALVEAGVDVDFPVVYRTEAGLESLIQAAGRCNREHKRPIDQSVVYVYRPEEEPPLRERRKVDTLRRVMKRFDDLAAPEAIAFYFDELHQLEGRDLDQKRILNAFDRGIDGVILPFATVAERFKLMGVEMKAILIPKEEEAAAIAERLEREGPSRGLLRQAGPYLVNVYDDHFDALERAGNLKVIGTDLAVLDNLIQYDGQRGLSTWDDPGRGLFV